MVRDKDGVNFARKAMLQCGLGLKNGVWEISQLKPELQGIIREIGRILMENLCLASELTLKIVVVMNKSRMLSIL